MAGKPNNGPGASTSKKMIVLFFLISLVMFGALFGYIGIRLWPTLISFHIGKNLFISILALFSLLPLLPIILQLAGFENRWIDALSWMGFGILGFASLVMTLMLARDLISSTVWIGTKVAGLFKSPEAVFNASRRVFMLNITNIGIIGLAGLGTIAGLINVIRRPKVIPVKIPITNLPEEFTRLKIVQFSDLHIGSTIKRSFIEKVSEQVNALNPDIVFFTGDAADGTVEYLRHDVEPLKNIKAPLGKYFVTGNHEYYSGVKPWTIELERLGYEVLTNSHKLISYQDRTLLLVGVPDPEAVRMDPENAPNLATALADAPEHDFSILLAHQPVAITAAAQHNIDLQLSGHTHGGQYIPWNYVVDIVQPYTAGLHKHGPTWIYVNRGTGYWGPPIRIGVPSEISEIRLVSSDK